ncbi:MAG TPA: cation-translocating P-type ATPase [Phycisphaerales bacterium]|nr:cation-translocating P-type ATPase [Phycisphaerales bacterium]
MLGKLFQPKGELIGSIIAGVFLLAGVVLHTGFKVEWGVAGFWVSLGVGLVFGCKAAWDALRKLTFDIDVLMVVGAVLAASIGHPGEGALLLFLFTLSGALEGLAMERTEREVKALHSLMPVEALVQRDGRWVPAPAESLVAGEVLKIRPGERVPVDCELTVGASSIDQSAITGESIPREVKVGDELFAGTINTDDPIEARVLRPASESSLQKILNLVTQAREEREPIHRLIDKLSQPYSIGVIVLAVTVLLVWHFVLKQPWVGEDGHSGALITAITLLIVASPCALVIATPTATLAAIARGARAGVLFKGGSALDRLARINSIALDKTGTLTFGKPRLYEMHPVAWSDGQRLLAIAAGLEADSTHPIATAVREAAKARGITPTPIENLNHTTAQGLSGMVDGAVVRLGRWTFVEPLVPVCLRARVIEVLGKIQDRGHIGVVIARQNAADPEAGEAAVLIMADSVRPGAQSLVPELHALGVKPVRMLTGDNRVTAERVGAALKLDKVDAELLPEDKLNIITQMHSDKARDHGHGGVAFIGDGVNDAPALARADVSMAIGTIGTAAALESADIVLLSDSLQPVAWSIRLARACRRTVRVNLTVAIGVIVLMGIATLVGSLIQRDVPLSVGVIAHEGGTVLVVLNSLRLLGIAKWSGQTTTH